MDKSFGGKALTVVLSFYFLLSGSCKLGALHDDTYHFFVEKYRVQVAPVWHRLETEAFHGKTQIFADPDSLRRVVGTLELIAALLVLLTSRFAKHGAILFVLLMAWTIATNVLSDEDPTFPSILCVLSCLKWYLSSRPKPMLNPLPAVKSPKSLEPKPIEKQKSS